MVDTNPGYHDAIMRRLGIIDSMGQIPQGLSSRPSNSGISNIPTGGNPLINFGRLLQSRGFRVGENPYFGGVTQGAHVSGSDHYRGHAIDVNYGPGGTSQEETRAINSILGLARQYGLKYIWQAPGHYNHGHFYY